MALLQWMGSFSPWLLVVLSSISVIAGDYFAKSWSVSQKTGLYLLSLLGYLLSSFFYIPSLLKEGLVITAVVWDMISVIGFLFIGLVLFHETLTTLQWVGVGLGLASLAVLAFAI